MVWDNLVIYNFCSKENNKNGIKVDYSLKQTSL